MSMAYPRVLALITILLLFFGPCPSLGSSAKLSSAAAGSLGKEHDNPMSFASQPTRAQTLSDGSLMSFASQPTRAQTLSDDSSFMEKLESENSMVAGFFKSKYPFPTWPFPKHPPFPFAKPAMPSAPTTPGSEESKKLPSTPIKDLPSTPIKDLPTTPIKDNGDGGSP